MPPLVQARSLTRTFDDRVAVDDLSLSVAGGEIVSLLGPNGAGKTTTFRMMAGLIAPTSGDVAIAGAAVSARAHGVRARVGLLTETPGLWERLSVRWNLRTHAELQGLDRPEECVTAVMVRVGIADRADDRSGALSKGLKQRVAMARALLHDPKVVLLDEPTAGLDPESARHVRDLIVELGREGRAVLVSTHNLAEAELLSDRIAILKTRLLACDTPDALRRSLRDVSVLVEVDGSAAAWTNAAGIDYPRVTIDGSIVTFRIPSPDVVPNIVSSLVAAGARVRRVEPRHASLEDAYLALVRQDG